MLSLREAMNHLFEGSFVQPGATWPGVPGSINASFPLNIWGTADELKVEALLPGVSQEDVQITVAQGMLTIAAKRHGWEPREGQHPQWYLQEIKPGQFARTLALPFPVEVEGVTADFANGVLTLTLPKAAAAKPKTIPVGAGQVQG